LGLDGWMQDFGEWLPHDAVLADGSDARRTHNLYPTLWHAAARAELEAQRGSDWVMFSRSGWLREARVAQVVWTGDQEATWSPHDGLPTVIPALVSLGMAGIGYTGADIAGFSGGPSTKELYERWVELAAFTPIFRTHDGLMRDANWRWDRDADTTAHFAHFARVHAALAPRFLELGQEHHDTGMPLLRALPLVFPDDPATYALTDEFMVGDDLLVAPVVTQGAVTRSVYLPIGRWFDVWDASRTYDGPVTVNVNAPIGRPPVFCTRARPDLATVP
ncbi:MAG: TIM-barrel domain-containing protein, partial [Deltaproteobacteria bacterium]